MRSNTIKQMSIEKGVNSPKLTFIIVRFVDCSFSSNECCFAIIQVAIYRSHIATSTEYGNITFFKMFVITSITNAKNIRNLALLPLPLKLRKSEIWD